MQSCTLRKTGYNRYPSVFAASVLFLIAVLGKLVSPYLAYGFKLFLSLFLFNISDDFLSRSSSIIYYFFFVILPITLYGGADERIGFTEYIRITPLSNRNCVICALIAVPGVALALMLTELWSTLIITLGGVIPEAGTALVPKNTAQLMGSLLVDAIVPAICEEILFRGVILSAWEEKGGRKAVLISAVLFTLLHASVSGLPAELAGRLIMGMIVLRGGSVFAGVIFHVCYNAIIRVMQYTLVTGGNGAEHLINIGGTMGVIAEIGVCALLIFVIALLVKAVKNSRGGEATFSEKESAVLSAGEIIVITCSVIAALSLYAYDLVDVLGVIKP